MDHDEKLLRELNKKRDIVRKNIFTILENSMGGHAGGTMSLIELVTVLYFHHLKLDPKDYDWPERDRLILSKAHCCEAIYAVLPEIGWVPREELTKYYCYASPFQGHADRWCTPGIEYSGGSLGQGLSFAAGMALAEKMKTKINPPQFAPSLRLRLMDKYNPLYRVFCIVGDGESHEGQMWEAAMFARKFKLDNLTCIVDYNKFSLGGPTEDVMPLSPLKEKWESFGWWVKEIDGHNMVEIADALDLSNNLYGDGKPKCIIAHTVKGKGVPAWEGSHVHIARGDAITIGVKEGREIYG